MLRLGSFVTNGRLWKQRRLVCLAKAPSRRVFSSAASPGQHPKSKPTEGPTIILQPHQHHHKPSPIPEAPQHVNIDQLVKHTYDLLPHQGILENFIHHNPLQHLETLNFMEALEYVRNIEAYMSPGERVFSYVDVDPRKRVNEALADLSSAFLDRGAAKWAPGHRDQGFLYFFASLETLGYAPWRKHARKVAPRILPIMNEKPNSSEDSRKLAESIIQENLEFFGIPPQDWSLAIHAMLNELRGWAGMFGRMETHPNEAPAGAMVRLIDFCAVQSILSRSSIENLAHQFGWKDSQLFHVWLGKVPTHRAGAHDTIPHDSAIAYVDQNAERREILETQFEHALLHSIGTTQTQDSEKPRPMLQLYTCIDDRECSIRRHVEKANPTAIETFGVAGFFGLPIRYKSIDVRDVMILAPEGQNPKEEMDEIEDQTHKGEVDNYKKRRRFFSHFTLAWENASFSPFGSLVLSALFPISFSRLFLMGFAPVAKYKIREFFRNTFLPQPHTDFELPIAPPVAATLLARTFKDIGTHRRFAPIVLILGHGAVSVNNPFAAAYNCGACGGRQGGPNARLLSRLANNPTVRQHLRTDHNIHIPDDTWFLGGQHNTTNDIIEFYDLERLPTTHTEHFHEVQRILEKARGDNALERCHRFLLATRVKTAEQALRHVRIRSTDAAEVRPELNHATNAAIVVGRRELTKGRFLDRRVFLPSYDPFFDDDQGTNLEHVLGPALIVCSGINLEYLFSTISVDHHGAGTKAPLNVVSNVGVIQGTTGDLRPGLPSQMTEMHTPVRALYVIDSPVDRVEAVLRRRPELANLVHNEWVRFFIRDPQTGLYFKSSRGQFVHVPDVIQDAKDLTIPFHHHRLHGIKVARFEAAIYWGASLGMIASCVGPIMLASGHHLNPYGPIVATCATFLALPVLAFSRRYLHGEYMFGRFASLCTGLLLGFNLVATATNLEQLMLGWSLFGFSSAFLIGAYNDRPTVRNNATFAFAVYRISDFALLVAATFSGIHSASVVTHHPLVAAGLLVAALFKSSQFPFTGLFARSMEGPTPASALGYAGLSAHVGVVLLAGTMPLWFDFEWARLLIGGVGAWTAVWATVLSKIRADRKGAIAYATSATLGLIFVMLALGYPKMALFASLGHAAFRMIQILRAPNIITDTQNLTNALERIPWPKIVPDWLYHLSWRLRRLDADFNMFSVPNWISSHLHISIKKRLKLTKIKQWLLTTVCVVLTGAPFTPFSTFLDHWLMEWLPIHPFVATGVMLSHYIFSLIIFRFLLVRVLSSQRFHKHFHRHIAADKKHSGHQ